MSKPFSIDAADLKKIGKSFAFSALAALTIAAGSVLDSATISKEWIFLVPVAHAVIEFMTRFVSDNTK